MKVTVIMTSLSVLHNIDIDPEFTATTWSLARETPLIYSKAFAFMRKNTFGVDGISLEMNKNSVIYKW